MDNLTKQLSNVQSNGYTIIKDIYSPSEIEAIIAVIDHADQTNNSFRKTDDLFAIRRFLKEVPAVQPLVFNEKLRNVISHLFGDDYFPVKSIYFDKPEKSNWFVAWHQDLTIAVDKKTELSGYGPWTVKDDQYAVQPPVEMLRDNFTIRIHLDYTNELNGALRVIPGSHMRDIQRVDSLDIKNETVDTCEVSIGGIMIMRPLLMHSSARTTNEKKRRVVHLEFSRMGLPGEINWAEKENF